MSAANPIKLTLVAGTLLLAAGCSSRADIEQEAFEIANQSLRTLNDEQGNKLFSFLVTVKAESKALLNKQGRYSKQELKKLFSTDSFVDSSALKMELEEQSVELLAEELAKENYCSGDYKIEEVVWRDYSVRLSGRCL